MAKVGTGTTLVFGTSGFTCEITSVDGPEVLIEAMDASHMGSATWAQMIFGTLKKIGALGVTIQYNGTETPPVGGDIETITCKYPGQTTGFSGTGKITAFKPQSEVEGKMTATMTVTFDGTTFASS